MSFSANLSIIIIIQRKMYKLPKRTIGIILLGTYTNKIIRVISIAYIL